MILKYNVRMYVVHVAMDVYGQNILKCKLKNMPIHILKACLYTYGTAQFKLHTRVCITRVYLVTPVKHF